jgi:hypothetical protein
MTLASKVVAVTEQMEEAGAIVLWHLNGEIDGELLKNAWISNGLDPDILPSMPSNETALRRTAMQYKEKRQLVRMLPNRSGWAVVGEVGSEGKLSYHQLFDFTLDKDGGIVATVHDEQAFIASGGAAKATAIFDASRAQLTHNDVSFWLARLVQNVDSIRLRDSGGVYFIPRNRLDEWRTFVAAIRAASSHVIYEVPALRSDEAVAAIIDSLTREAEEEAKGIETELDQGELGGRAIKSRAARCQAMSQKVSAYEELLGQSLDVLRERLEHLQASIAMAALSASEEDSK